MKTLAFMALIGAIIFVAIASDPSAVEPKDGGPSVLGMGMFVFVIVGSSVALIVGVLYGLVKAGENMADPETHTFHHTHITYEEIEQPEPKFPKGKFNSAYA